MVFSLAYATRSSTPHLVRTRIWHIHEFDAFLFARTATDARYGRRCAADWPRAGTMGAAKLANDSVIGCMPDNEQMAKRAALRALAWIVGLADRMSYLRLQAGVDLLKMRNTSAAEIVSHVTVCGVVSQGLAWQRCWFGDYVFRRRQTFGMHSCEVGCLACSRRIGHSSLPTAVQLLREK
jgi:hypothetical protein